MSRMTWNAPEGRFVDTGLDRGVLYPRKSSDIGDIVGVNRIRNPSFEVNTDTWSVYTGGSVGSNAISTMALSAAPYGGRVCRVNASTLSSGVGNHLGIKTTDYVNVEPGKIFCASAYFGPGLAAGRNLNALITQHTSNGTYIKGDRNWRAASEGRLQVVANIEPNCAKVLVYFYVDGGTAASGIIDYWIDGALLAEGINVPYFDGSFPVDLGFTYEWAGTPSASSSYKRQRLSSAVAWNGLTSVDEQGADGAAEYYIDGRPFLFLPRPKEYKATLNAYTYPDAFSEIMGLTEIADGMYLDSQPGEAFDLCYRTLVGNQMEGLEHGYKLHLVYNATVTPQSLTYESMSTSINPTTFAWEIQAVPVRVEGFRPTAHIIIDTRHMDADKVATLEGLLYGSDEVAAHMPTPQVIFDLLSYGDTIIVTDNGDGTFNVEGSYENVYMLDTGVFRVDNVDGQDNGNGTFTISTTDA